MLLQSFSLFQPSLPPAASYFSLQIYVVGLAINWLRLFFQINCIVAICFMVYLHNLLFTLESFLYFLFQL